jgi:hypothetical protein
MPEDVKSEIGEQVAKKLAQRKPAMFKTTKKGYMVIRVDLADVYTGLGMIDDAAQTIRDMIVMARVQRAQAKEAQRIQIAGGDTLRKGAMKDPNWFKKTFSK